MDPSTIRVNELATVTVTLEGSLAGRDAIDLALSRLAIAEGPSVSSQFEWINGRTTRRKIFTYRVRPLGAGTATAGPLRLQGDDGRPVVLPAVTITVLAGPPPLAAGESASIERLLREGQGLAVVPTVTPRTVVRGEQIDATWYLYTDWDDDMRGARISATPALDGFWTEELEIPSGEEDRVAIAGRRVRRIPVRRMALFPLRDGTLVITALEITVRTVEAARDPFGGWSLRERRIVDARRASPALEVVVRSLAEPAPNIGTYELRCSAPRVPAAGPVSFDATVEGRGNLRSVEAPVWSEPPEGAQEIDDLGITVHRTEHGIVMRRSWRYLLFPAAAGRLALPPLSFSFYDPLASSLRRVSCDATTIEVPRSVSRPAVPAAASPAADGNPAGAIPIELWIGAAVIGLLGAALALFVASTRHRRRPEWRSLMAVSRAPGEARERIGRILQAHGLHIGALVEEPEEPGESFRALMSLVDLMEKEPWETESLQADYRLRVRDFLSALAECTARRDGGDDAPRSHEGH